MGPRQRLMLLASVLLLTPAPAAASAVVIEEIGLQGRVANSPLPTRVRLLVTNPSPRPQALEVGVRVGGDPTFVRRRADRFSITLSLGPGERRAVDVPVLARAEEFVQVSAHDAAGNLLGEHRRKIARAGGHLVALLCRAEAVCQTVQSRISFSGTDEDRVWKRQNLALEVVREPPAAWWAFSAATAVLVAAPLSHLAPEQRETLELYARQGGNLVLVEDLAGDGEFLAPYRTGRPTGESQAIGMGQLYAVQSAAGGGLDRLFSAPLVHRLLSGGIVTSQVYQNSELTWARRRLADPFNFPGLGWLMAWLAVYTLVVGLFNFSLLRWLGRREWAWVTVPLVALGFAAALYAASVAERPRDFTLGQVALYWMDERSSLAAGEVALRLAAPRRAVVTLAVSGNDVFTGPGWRGWEDRLSAFPALQQAGTGERGWSVRVGPPQRFELQVLQWSFADVELRGVRRLPGTVRRVGAGRLLNETGQTFSQAIYVDRQTVRFLAAVLSGAEVDLGAARREPLSAHVGRRGPYPRTLSRAPYQGGERDRDVEELQQLGRSPFALVELIRGWPPNGGHAFDGRSALFIGLAEGPAVGAEIPGVHVGRKQHILAVVSLGPEP